MKLRDFLYLNKSDRHAVLMLLSLAAIVLTTISITGSKEQETTDNAGAPTPTTAHDAAGEAATRTKAAPAKKQQTYYRQERKVERFTFDPNTADSTALLRLGLRPWQVLNIYKYRAAGGIYRSKEDYAQLYGLTVKEYRELEPYIRISPDYLPASTLFDKRSDSDGAQTPQAAGNETGNERRHYPEKLKDGETIDLNIADTTDLKSVPGIGSYYARRIAEYRQRLGGYVSTDQLDDIDDLPEEVKQFFVVSQPHPHQIAINRLALNELRRHPYINYYQARAITDYRRLHGPIKALSQLRLLPEFPPEAIERLEPYVSYE